RRGWPLSPRNSRLAGSSLSLLLALLVQVVDGLGAEVLHAFGTAPDGGIEPHLGAGLPERSPEHLAECSGVLALSVATGLTTLLAGLVLGDERVLRLSFVRFGLDLRGGGHWLSL